MGDPPAIGTPIVHPLNHTISLTNSFQAISRVSPNEMSLTERYFVTDVSEETKEKKRGGSVSKVSVFFFPLSSHPHFPASAPFLSFSPLSPARRSWFLLPKILTVLRLSISVISPQLLIRDMVPSWLTTRGPRWSSLVEASPPLMSSVMVLLPLLLLPPSLLLPPPPPPPPSAEFPPADDNVSPSGSGGKARGPSRR